MSERENGSLGLSLYLLVLLTALHTLSLTDRFLIAAFGTQISLDLGLSNQQFGLVTGLAFTLFYASTGPVAGLLVDRFGPGRLLGTGVLIWSAMTGLTGMAKSFLGLWLPRTLVGVGEAILIPAASKILSTRFD
ncbi:MAG: MFS transporter, partial [Halieaceae bacterium]